MTQTKALETKLEFGGYSAGHPWYYLLGGRVPVLKQIRACAVIFEQRGYRSEEIDAAHKLPEPKRTATLAELRASILDELCRDVRGYRSAVRELSKHRKKQSLTKNPTACEGVHVAISLNFSHLLNDFIHLRKLDSLPSQLSLF